MVTATLTRVESHITPPSTPSISTESQPSQPAGMSVKACISKTCIHKTTESDQMSGEKSTSKSKSKKEESETESSSDDSSSSSSDSSSESSSDSEEEVKSSKKSKKESSKSSRKTRRRRRKSDKRRKTKTTQKEEPASDTTVTPTTTDDATPSAELEAVGTALKALGIDLKLLLGSRVTQAETSKDSADDESDSDDSSSDDERRSKKKKKSKKSSKKEKKEKKEKKKKSKSGLKAEFKRLDEIWDEEIYDYKLKETTSEKKEDEYADYIFTVRRKFDDEGRYQKTVVYINSEPLKASLKIVLDGVDTVSLVEETPELDPNLLFLFFDECKALLETLEAEKKEASKKKERKAVATQITHLKVLTDYLDDDYSDTRKRLNPLMQNGRITFDLMWALFKPNTLVYTTAFNDDSQPRAFKVISSYVTRSFTKGVYYAIEGKYLDFDGKSFGNADAYAEVMAFQGTRKITALHCYPLNKHSDTQKLRTRLLERGMKFLTLAGMNYRLYKGMAYVRKDDKFLKANVNGRIMIDPGTFRRINPNYSLNDVEPRDVEELDENDECQCKDNERKKKKPNQPVQRLFRLVKEDDKDDAKVIEVDPSEQELLEQQVDSSEMEKQVRNTFTEEELVTASAVLQGFSFSEKAWLEFAVSEVKEVVWNEGAFESLVLPEQHKSIVRALVSAHGMHSSKAIDDVIAGKGRGLVAVLHGRPGLGKTLTCEAVSDLLRRPLYTVSAGDLGTNACQLETELQAILDIAHTWGAVLLMDEADVFLAERSINDVHRNALVSIFLRLLEYFQGILFLTTNRVETFDEAFVSRIHLSLRYNDLTTKAKKVVWKTFIDKVRATEGMDVGPITEEDYLDLARQDMNGRQIKNLVKTAQALALHEGVAMGMHHIRKVIDVSRSFEQDLKGGRGFEEAMRSYT